MRLIPSPSSPRVTRRFRPWLGAGAAFALGAGALLGAPAQEPVKLSVERVASKWKEDWFDYAKRTIKIDDAHYACPLWDTRYPSSRLMSVGEAVAKGTEQVSVSNAGLTRIHEIVPDRADVEAYIQAIPSLDQGQFGHIHSVKVEAIEGPHMFLASDVWLIDERAVKADIKEIEDKIAHAEKIIRRNTEINNNRNNNNGNNDNGSTVNRDEQTQVKEARKELERRFKGRNELLKLERGPGFKAPLVIVGVPTGPLRVGQRWPSEHVKETTQMAVGGRYTPVKKAAAVTTAAGAGTPAAPRVSRGERTVLFPAALLRKPLDERQFSELVEKAQISKEQFASMCIEQARLYPREPAMAEAYVFDKILRGAAAAAVPGAEAPAVAAGKSRSGVDAPVTPADAPAKDGDAKKPDAAAAKPARPLFSWEKKKLEQQQKDAAGKAGAEGGDKPKGDEQAASDKGPDRPVKEEGAATGGESKKPEGGKTAPAKPARPLYSYEKKKLEQQQREEAARKAAEQEGDPKAEK